MKLRVVVLTGVLLLALMPPFCQAAVQKQESDCWAPLSFRDYLLQQSHQTKRPTTSLTSASVCRDRAEAWTAAVTLSINLSESQKSRVRDLAYQRELGRQKYSAAVEDCIDRVMYPFTSGSYDEAQFTDWLQGYFNAAADAAVHDVKFWHGFRSVVSSGGTASEDFLRTHWEHASDCLKAGNQPSVPGLCRLQARLGYAKFLQPTSANQLQSIYTDAATEAHPLMDRLMELVMKMDALESSGEPDENALRAIAREGLNAQIQIGLIDLKAEWKMLKLLPEDYQGTWVRVPPGTRVPKQQD